MKPPTLLVLAAGLGSRYGGLKQLDAMGPNGETVLDYSVYDAIRAGFGAVVFVIRREFADAFAATVGKTFQGQIKVAYAFQDLDDLPMGFTVPNGRTKPWGTAHAVWAARKLIETPFAVINADDFYGADAYQRMVSHFIHSADKREPHVSLVTYPLRNTLSSHGSVNRGLCQVTEGALRSVEEHTEIAWDKNGEVRGLNAAGQCVKLDPDAPVSMNFWGFSPALFESLEVHFTEFLKHRGTELNSECYLPSVVDKLIREDRARCAVLETQAEWFGVTYPEDKPAVEKAIARLIESKAYPKCLRQDGGGGV